MTSKGEMIGAALAKAVKAATGITSAKLGASMYRTNIKDVPKVEGLKRDDGWIDMQVQFLIDKKSAGADNVVGWTVLKPGASHERHLHRNCDEFFIVLKGQGHIITDKGLEPSVEGDVVYSPRGVWHGFNNTSNDGCGAGLGLDGRGIDRGVGLRKSARRAFMSETLKDPRIADGMRAQMALRQSCSTAAPSRSAGRSGSARRPCKPSAVSPRRSSAFCSTARSLPRARRVSLAGWHKPVAEAEIAAYIGHDLSAGADRDDVRKAIVALGPAIELADPTTPMDDVQAALAGGIFQRHVILGPRDPMRSGARLDGLRAGSPAAARMFPSPRTSRPTSAKWSTSSAMSPTWQRRSAAVCAPDISSSAAR